MKRSNINLPLGKLPVELLNRIISDAPNFDQRIILGPGIGIDCAVIDMGERLLVFKSDPITFVTQEIGWYAVQVCANDIATTGATPRWFLSTLLLPQKTANEAMALQISTQIHKACRQFEISVIGGHSEITHGLERPIVIGTLIGEVEPGRLVSPRGAKPGHRLLLTKGVPIEATAILAREFPGRLAQTMSEEEIRQASDFLYNPGISVLRDSNLAMAAGQVTAMHDPTEGGLAAALWEMAEASACTVCFDPQSVFIPPLSRRVCDYFNLDPLATIASGALLIATPVEFAVGICHTMEEQGIHCFDIGSFEDGQPGVWYNSASGRQMLPRPSRDEITKVFET